MVTATVAAACFAIASTIADTASASIGYRYIPKTPSIAERTTDESDHAVIYGRWDNGGLAAEAPAARGINIPLHIKASEAVRYMTLEDVRIFDAALMESVTIIHEGELI